MTKKYYYEKFYLGTFNDKKFTNFNFINYIGIPNFKIYQNLKDLLNNNENLDEDIKDKLKFYEKCLKILNKDFKENLKNIKNIIKELEKNEK